MAEVRVGGAFLDFYARTVRLVRGITTSNRALRSQQRALQRLQRTARSVRRTFARLQSQFFSFRTILYTLIGGGGLSILIKRHVFLADATIKGARATALSTTAFQELRHAAEIAGISHENFLTTMIAFTKRVGEARVGMGRLDALLEKMDRSLLGVIRQSTSTEEAFNHIIGSALRMRNELDRVALLSAAFGRTIGPQLANFLLQGSEGIDAVRKSAQLLGVVLEADLLKKAESLADRITELQRAIQAAISREILRNADKITDFIARLIRQLPELVKLATGLAERMNEFFQVFIRNFETIARVVGAVVVALKGLTIGTALGGPVGGLIGLLIGGGAGAVAGGAVARELDSIVNKTSKIRRLERELAALNTQIANIGSSGSSIGSVFARAVGDTTAIKNNLEAAATFVARIATVLASAALGGVIGAFATASPLGALPGAILGGGVGAALSLMVSEQFRAVEGQMALNTELEETTRHMREQGRIVAATSLKETQKEIGLISKAISVLVNPDIYDRGLQRLEKAFTFLREGYENLGKQSLEEKLANRSPAERAVIEAAIKQRDFLQAELDKEIEANKRRPQAPAPTFPNLLPLDPQKVFRANTALDGTRRALEGIRQTGLDLAQASELRLRLLGLEGRERFIQQRVAETALRIERKRLTIAQEIGVLTRRLRGAEAANDVNAIEESTRLLENHREALGFLNREKAGTLTRARINASFEADARTAAARGEQQRKVNQYLVQTEQFVRDITARQGSGVAEAETQLYLVRLTGEARQREVDRIRVQTEIAEHLGALEAERLRLTKEIAAEQDIEKYAALSAELVQLAQAQASFQARIPGLIAEEIPARALARDIARQARLEEAKQLRILEFTKNAALDLGETLSSGLGAALTHVDGLREGFRGLAEEISLAARTLRSELYAAISRAGLARLFDQVDSAAKGISRRIDRERTIQALRDPRRAVPRRQSGGSAYGLTLVGEGGPEVADFGRPARIYNNEQLARALRGLGPAGVRGGAGKLEVNVSSDINAAALAQATISIVPELRRLWLGDINGVFDKRLVRR